MGKVRVWLAFRERETGIIEDEVIVDAVKDMFRDLAGITLKRVNAVKLGLIGDQLVLSAAVSPDKYIKVLSTFHELLLSSLLRNRYRRSWTMVMTSRPVGAGKDRANKNVVPVWYLFELKNGLFLDVNIEKTLVTNSVFKITWFRKAQIFQQTLLALYVPWQWERDSSENEEEFSAPTDPVPLWPSRPTPVPRQMSKEPASDRYEERAPTEPAPLPRPIPRPAPVNRTEWIRTLDPGYNPYQRERTGPASLGGAVFLASIRLNKYGYTVGGDPSYYIKKLPTPEEVGLVRCTEDADISVMMVRSEVAVDEVQAGSSEKSVTVSATNVSPHPIRVRIPQGMAFEVEVPHIGVQCLVTQRAVEFELGPGETWRDRIYCYCANSGFSLPEGSPMRVTPYRTAKALMSQDEVWAYFNGFSENKEEPVAAAV